MSYKIIVDSCGELTEEMKASGCFETASLEIDVHGRHIIDDETFDQAEFLRLVAESPDSPKSSCIWKGIAAMPSMCTRSHYPRS